MARNIFKIVMTTCAMSSLLASSIMTHPGFNVIELGAPVDAIVKSHGEPYSIRVNQDGSKDYLYIERIPVGQDVVRENRYILVIKNGQVVSKRFNQENPPAYDEIYDDDPNDVPE